MPGNNEPPANTTRPDPAADTVDETAEITRRLGMAVEASRRLASSRDEATLCRCLLAELGRITAAAGGSIYRARGGELSLVSSLDPGHAIEFRPTGSRGSVLGQAITARVPLLVPDLRADAELTPSGWPGYSSRSLMVLPLLDADERVLGAICLHDPQRPPFTAQDLDLGLLLGSVGVEVLKSLEAADAVRESEHRLRRLVENASDIVCVLDSDGRVVFVAPSVEHVLGYAPADLVGRMVESATDPRQRGQVRRMLDELAGRPGATHSVSLRLRHRDGSWRVLEALAKSALDEPAVKGIVVNARDVTEQVEAHRREMEQEEQLLQAAKLASLGTLVSGIAHEINNPNNFIRLNAENLRELWEDVERHLDGANAEGELTLRGIPYPEARVMAREMLNGLREGSLRIERIVGSLRDYARTPEYGVKDRVNVNDAVEGALTILASLVRSTTTKFTVRLASDPPPVLGSLQQIEQVVMNLVSNACQALPNRDAGLSVATRYDPATREVILCVADEGAGIPPQHLERVFEPFFTTKRQAGGMGLGLAICDRIARNHGGRIEIVSTLGVGTTMLLILPAESA